MLTIMEAVLPQSMRDLTLLPKYQKVLLWRAILAVQDRDTPIVSAVIYWKLTVIVHLESHNSSASLRVAYKVLKADLFSCQRLIVFMITVAIGSWCITTLTIEYSRAWQCFSLRQWYCN